MRCAIALAALLGSAAAATVNIKVTNGCDSSCKTSGVTIHAPTSAPDPGSFSFDGTGTLGVDVDSTSTMNLALKLGGVPVLNKNVPACGTQTISLPVGLGTVDVTGPPCSPPQKAGSTIKLAATVTSNAVLPAEVKGVATYKQGADTLVIIDIDITPAKALAAAPACNATDSQIWNATGFQNFQDDMTACGKQCLGKDTCVSQDRRRYAPPCNQCVAGKEHYSAPCSACFGALGLIAAPTTGRTCARTE